MKRFFLLALLASSTVPTAHAKPLSYAPEQLVAQAKMLYGKFVSASQANDAKRLIELYHDSAKIVVVRQSATTGERTIELTGVQYKQIMRVTPLTEAADRYFNPSYSVLKGGQVQISMQRQSVSRGYTVPNVLIVQPDTTGRFWIVLEKGIQKVK